MTAGNRPPPSGSAPATAQLYFVSQRLTPQQQQTRALQVVRAIEPKKVIGFNKIRIGRDRDGGYINVNDFTDVGAALSFGIADDVSWDLDIASRGTPVYQYDHTIPRAPVEHPLLAFQQKRIAAVDGPNCASLSTLVDEHLSQCSRAILKIDIEGDEWPLFNATPIEKLARFSQIVCEFHEFHRAGEATWSDRAFGVLTKLRESFEVVHVHGNNARPFANIANVVLPQLLEITFANRRYYEFAQTEEIFPTDIDRPNLADKPDLWLGCFKY